MDRFIPPHFCSLNCNGIRFYRYDPIVAPAIVALILFFLTTALYIYQVSRTRTWYMIPMIVGGLSKILVVQLSL